MNSNQFQGKVITENRENFESASLQFLLNFYLVRRKNNRIFSLEEKRKKNHAIYV